MATSKTGSILYFDDEADYPLGRNNLFPPELNYIPHEFIPLSSDEADLICDGMITYYTGGTNGNDVTRVGTLYGADDREENIFLIGRNPSRVDLPRYKSNPHKGLVPWDEDVSAALTPYVYGENQPMKGAQILPGHVHWSLIGLDATADVTYNYTYFTKATGLNGQAGGDPDGGAIDKKAHAWTPLATWTNSNWALMRCLGIRAYDSSA